MTHSKIAQKILDETPQEVKDKVKTYADARVAAIEQWYRIELPYATFAITTKNDLVERTAPIARWMKFKHIADIVRWVESKNGIIEPLN